MNIKEIKRIPIDDAVTLADAKEHLRVTDDCEDGYITNLIRGGVDHASQFLGFCVNSQEVTYQITGYDADKDDIFVEDGPNCSCVVKSIAAADGSCLEYTVDAQTGRIGLPEGVNELSVITVEVPDLTNKSFLKSAILLYVGKMFEQRGDDNAAVTQGGWAAIDRLLAAVSVRSLR